MFGFWNDRLVRAADVGGSASPADLFAQAFSELADDGQPVVAKPEPPAGTDQVPAAPVGDLPDPSTLDVDDGSAGTEAEGSGEPDQGDRPKDDDRSQPRSGAGSEPSNEELMARFRAIMAEGQKAAAQPAQSAPDQHSQQQQPQQPVASPAPAPYTAEEKAVVDAYLKEWPEIAAAEQLQRRTEYRELCNYVFAQVAPFLRQQQQTIQDLMARSHMADLHVAAPDYSTIRDDVVDWVGRQNGFLKPTYQRVVDQGTPEEVAQLIGLWRQATNNPSERPTPALVAASQAPVSTQRPSMQPQVSRRVLDALKPARAQRTNISQNEIGADDFDGAFRAFSDAST